MPEPQHFSDYGFDPQIGYFQVLEEAMKRKRETVRPIDSIHFKLQKPISKDDCRKPHKAKRRRWWKNPLLFFKWRKTRHDHDDEDVHQARARAFRASVSGPVYMTESTSGSSTPHRTTSRRSSGPLAGMLTPLRKGDVDIPYLSLRELTMEQQQQQRMSTSTMPVYLVT
ncbi:Collagen alpha-1(III) chain like [Quillaja saponaria]|uniref:Collagen alpha-1(III) chain like n=1 Tax=Quillaja saponaria TaxID=32244 RepID=A0AAD7QG97_QUISA|nr:Collagen alpha-1(III) chain like [Quillaja saponaria]